MLSPEHMCHSNTKGPNTKSKDVTSQITLYLEKSFLDFPSGVSNYSFVGILRVTYVLTEYVFLNSPLSSRFLFMLSIAGNYSMFLFETSVFMLDCGIFFYSFLFSLEFLVTFLDPMPLLCLHLLFLSAQSFYLV